MSFIRLILNYQYCKNSKNPRHLIFNPSGFSLVGVLVAAGCFSIMSLAMLKTFQSSLHSQAVLSSLMTDQDLKQAIRKSFDGASCAKNMENVQGDSITELKYYSSSTDTGTALVEKGLFKETLDIVKIAVENEPSDPNHKKVTTYYKRKGLGVLSTRDQEPCTETDLSGCYADHCKMVYKTGGIDDICSLLNCSSLNKNSLSGISCGDGKYLDGFDEQGIKICLDKNILLANLSCPSGQYLSGFNADGSLKCLPLPASAQPEPPEVPVQVEVPATQYACSMVDNKLHGLICACHHPPGRTVFAKKVGNTCYSCPQDLRYYMKKCYSHL